MRRDEGDLAFREPKVAGRVGVALGTRMDSVPVWRFSAKGLQNLRQAEALEISADDIATLRRSSPAVSRPAHGAGRDAAPGARAPAVIPRAGVPLIPQCGSPHASTSKVYPGRSSLGKPRDGIVVFEGEGAGHRPRSVNRRVCAGRRPPRAWREVIAAEGPETRWAEAPYHSTITSSDARRSRSA